MTNRNSVTVSTGRNSNPAPQRLCFSSGCGALLPLLLLLSIGCAAGSVKTIPLLKTSGIPWTTTVRPDVPLEIITRGNLVPDPLKVRGAPIAYADVEEALGMAVGTAAVPWAQEHRPQRPEGWQLLVELVEAEAKYEDSRLNVNLTVRATLRTRRESTYLAQKYANCEQAGLVAPSEGASVLYSCMARVGRDLAAWLGGVEP